MIRKLSQMEYGEHGIVKEIQKGKREITHMGIRVGKRLKMVTKQPIQGPVVVAIGEVEVAMGLDLAQHILVEVAEMPPPGSKRE
jgi:ferrous iron transport protein A